VEQVALQSWLDDLHSTTGSQCALVVLEDLQGRNSELTTFRVFGTSLFNDWGVGSAEHNNGVLVLLFHEARRLEIITGTGMSWVLSDAWLAGMQEREMVPHFKAGDYSKGLISGISAITQKLQSSAPREWRKSTTDAEGPLAISDSNVLDESSTQVVPSFGGGGSVYKSDSGHKSKGRKSTGRSSADDTTMQVVMRLGLWLAGGALQLSNWLDSTCKLQRLEAELRKLQEPRTFKDALGAKKTWPYQVAPEKMGGLLDVTSEQFGLQHARTHPFELASCSQLDVDATANGFGNRALALKVRNTSSDNVVVHLPAGALFVVDSDVSGRRVQPLISVADACVTLAPGEENTLLLDAYCADSGGSVPRGRLVMSPYILSSKYLATQASVWQWSAQYQPRGSEWDAASKDFQTLQASFGMKEEEAQLLLQQLEEAASRANDELEREVQSLRQRIVEQQRAIEREEDRLRQQIRTTSSPNDSSGRSSFGGGRSCGVPRAPARRVIA